jgi:hypothetical protein
MHPRVLSVVEHPVYGPEPEILGLVVVVEDRLVDLTGDGVLVGIFVLDVAKFEQRVRVARGLDQLVRALVVEVLRRPVGRRCFVRSSQPCGSGTA